MTFLVLHLSATHQALREGTFTTRQNLEADVRTFFVLPIPQEVWQRTKVLHEPDFVAFVERGLRVRIGTVEP